MDQGQWGWIAAAAAALVMLIREVAAVLGSRAKRTAEDERTAVGYLRGIVDDLRKQLTLHAAQMNDAQTAIRLLREECAECSREQESQWAEIVRQYEYGMRQHRVACRLAEALRKLGHEADGPEEPVRPVRRERHREARDAADYAARTAEQGAVMIRERDRAAADSRGAP